MRSSKLSLSHAFGTASTMINQHHAFQKQMSLTARNHIMCDRCKGTGKILIPPSKKVLNAYEYKLTKIVKRKSLSESSSIELPPPKSRTGKCLQCQGVGVVEKESSYNHEMKCSDQDASESGVIIVGGGIGGFALALALQQRGIHVRVYEKDTCFSERAQGYGLTMQQVKYIMYFL